jgi:hypothetical protein
MSKVLSVFLLLCVVFAVSAQAVDPSLLDLSKAKASVAGPDKVYVRSIYYGGESLSVLLVYNGVDGATVYGPYFAEDKYLQDGYELGYVKFKAEEGNTLLISDVMLTEQLAYSGRVRWEGGDTLRLVSFWESVPPVTCESEVAYLKKRVKDLEEKPPEKVVEKVVETKYVERVAPEKVEELPSKTVFSGFSGGKALTGNWTATANSAKQVDTKQLYAKYSIPVSQDQAQTLFSFNAKLSGEGWVGYGLHFFASGDKRSDTYGFGKSFLVWLTRDPFYYRSERTYLQLYRSFDDVTMIQVASVSISESIFSSLKVDVYYDRSKNVIAAYVNGDKKLEFKEVDSAIWNGSKIALRTLGGEVEFSNFAVKTR